MQTELDPQILYPDTFEIDTFSISKLPSSLNLSEKMQKSVAENWQIFLQEAKKKGNTPWNGTHYRLENVNELKNKTNVLNLSTIKYSTRIGLTYHADLSILKESEYSNHISTGSLLQTSDGYFVFGQRNANTMSSYNIDFIGGGLQPDELEVQSCKDIFANMEKEILEETNIDKKHIEQMLGIGIVLSASTNVIFIFHTKLDLTKSEVLKIFEQNDKDEMSDLVFVTEENLSEFLKDSGSYRPLVAELYLNNKDRI